MSALLILLGMLAAVAVLVSEMPRAAAWPLAVAATVHGLWRAHREHRRPIRTIVWDGRARVVRVDGVVVADPMLDWRGTLAFLHWRNADGRRERLAFWPDVLGRAGRRELRLAAGGASSSRSQASMAP